MTELHGPGRRLLATLAAGLAGLGLVGQAPGARAAEAVPPAPGTWQAVPFAALEVPEASGLAPSTRAPGTLWVNNDSFNPAAIHRLDPASGRVVQTLRVAAPEAWDWEDLSAFTWHGLPWLLIADTGNNLASRRVLALDILPEPPPNLPTLRLAPAWQVLIDFPGDLFDGAPDIEAVAADADAGWVYLVSKRQAPPHLWRVPLGSPAAARPGVVRATDLGPLALPRPGRPGHPRDWPTALALAPDHRRAVLVTYRQAHLWYGTPGTDWGVVLRRPPDLTLELPPVGGIEGATIDATDRLWVAAEGLPLRVFRTQLPGVP